MDRCEEPDERGIDLAILAFIGARLAGESKEKASSEAQAMLTLFGFEPHSKDSDNEG